MDKNDELFKGTSFADLMSDVYHNSKKKDRQINQLIAQLQPLIKNASDATIIVPLIKECLVIKKAFYEPKSLVLSVEVENVSSCNFILQNQSPYSLIESSDLIEIEGKSTMTLHFRTKEKINQLNWSFNVLNAVNAPNKHPVVTKEVVINSN